jgi:hypothetical protein
MQLQSIGTALYPIAAVFMAIDNKAAYSSCTLFRGLLVDLLSQILTLLNFSVKLTVLSSYQI